MMIFITVWIIWSSSEIILNMFMRSGSNDKQDQDKGSLKFIWMLVPLSLASGIIFSYFTKFSISNDSLVAYIGLAIIVAGMALRFTSIWTLGRYFTLDVTIREGHKIKDNGLYGVIRHPSYTGAILSFIGFGMSLNNWLSIMSATVLMTIGMINRIRIEEKVLTDQFGADYINYKKKTYRLIPWIY